MVAGEPIPVKGMAWTSALGDGLDEVWEKLMSGQSGITDRTVSQRLRSRLAAALRVPDSTVAAEDRLRVLSAQTISRALADAGEDVGRADLQLIIGTSLGSYLDQIELPSSLSRWTLEVARDLGLAREPVLVSTACSSGADAIQVGAALLRSGAAGVCVCGGADILTLNKRMGHSLLGTMSPTGLRAFDRKHSGTILGEGAAFLVLGAPGWGPAKTSLLGTGSANDAMGMTAPDPAARGAILAIRRSLHDAGIGPDDVGLINAHGSGTPINDQIERDTFAALFGDLPRRPLVFATKGNFGHSLGATGAIEAIALILALEKQQVPPIVGLEQQIEGFVCSLARDAMACSAQVGLSLTLGFGGFDTSLIFSTKSSIER